MSRSFILSRLSALLDRKSINAFMSYRSFILALSLGKRGRHSTETIINYKRTIPIYRRKVSNKLRKMCSFCLSAFCPRRAFPTFGSNETCMNYGLTRKSLHSIPKLVEGEPPWHGLLRRRQPRKRWKRKN